MEKFKEVNLENREARTQSVRVETNLETAMPKASWQIRVAKGGPPGAPTTYECILRMHLPAWAAASLARQFNTASICHLSY